MTAFFVVGGVVAALSDLIYLAGTEYWRETGWTAQPAERMVAVGRSFDVVNALTRWPEAAGFVILAAGLVCLGRLSRRDELPSRLGLLVNLEALLLLGIAQTCRFQGKSFLQFLLSGEPVPDTFKARKRRTRSIAVIPAPSSDDR